MKTTLDLPDELILEIKMRAVVQRRTVKNLVTEILRKGLGMVPPTQGVPPSANSMIDIGPQGFPVVRCSVDAPAIRMGVKELLQLEHASQTAEDVQRAGIPL